MDELISAEECHALLSRELDAWLRGDRSRRHVLAGLLGVAAAAGGTFLPAGAEAASRATGLGRHQDSALRLAAVELASPDTPLGKAQAAAVKASTEGPADGSAFRAVQAAKQVQGRHPQHDLRGRPAGAGARATSPGRSGSS